MNKTIVVSRHPAAIQFIARAVGGEVHSMMAQYPNTAVVQSIRVIRETGEEYIPIVASATKENVFGAVVYGNLPMHLASLAKMCIAVEFSADAPRGTEWTLEQMDAAGAHLSKYIVLTVDYAGKVGVV